MSVSLAPPPVFQAFGPNGQFLVGGQLFTYQAGTVIPLATYVDSTQTTTNTNPIILNALGQASVWLIVGQAYKFVLQDASGNPIYTQDQINITPSNQTINGVGGIALTVNAAASFPGIQINAPATVGQSNGLSIKAGTNSSDFPLSIQNAAGVTMLTENGAGTLTLTAQPAAIPLQINTGTNTSPAMNVTGAALTALNILEFQQTGQSQWLMYNPAASNDLRLNVLGGDKFTFNNAGNFTMAGNLSVAGSASLIGSLGILGNAAPAQVTGWGTPTGPVVVNNYSGSAATLVQTSNAVAQIIATLKAFGLFGT